MQIVLENITIPPPAQTVLQEFISIITTFRKNLVLGIYITGSIPLNDFHPGKSDIDFLVLCSEFPDETVKKEIKQIHKTIANKFKSLNLNGYYITYEGLNVHNAGSVKSYYVQEGKFREIVFEMAPIMLYELKHNAITIFGTAARELPVIVSQKDLFPFLHRNLNTYWKTWIGRFSLKRILLFLFPQITEWTLLGIARQFYTLKTGNIASKTAAGHYCLTYLPHKLHPVMQKAINIRKEKRAQFLTVKNTDTIQPSFKRSAETVRCARYMMQLFNEEYCKRIV